MNFLDDQSAKKILQWFEQNRVSYPWSPEKTDTWGIWVSEVMLQQTTVAAVVPRFHRWMERYPTPEALAAADIEEVLLEWEGLGYYHRARHLAQAAGEVQRRYGGRIPDTVAELRSLPGVGSYTAAAVASFGFGERVAAVDANARRIAIRLAAADQWNRELERNFAEWMEREMPEESPGDLNAAVMQLGQRVCTPRNPDCTACPLISDCQARATGQQDSIPQRRLLDVVKMSTRVALLVDADRIWLRRRGEGIGKGLWVFPPEADILELESLEVAEAATDLPHRVHAYTRYRETLVPTVYLAQDWSKRSLMSDGEWTKLEELNRRPMPTAYRRIATSFLGVYLY